MRKLNAQISVSGGGGGGGGGRGGGRGGGAGGGGLSSATATISAPAENFVAAMRLAVEMLKEPAYPQDDFDRDQDAAPEGAGETCRPSRPSLPPSDCSGT